LRLIPAAERALAGALLLVLAALAVSAVRPQWYRPIRHPVATAQSDMEEIAAALETYRHDVGRYPTTTEGLGALTHRPNFTPSDSTWYGPYVTSTMPLDPWGHAYEYRRGADIYQLWSDGADGHPGGEGKSADVVFAGGGPSR